MRRALALADRAGNEGEVPIGAVIVKDGQLLGEGWNSVIAFKDPTAHAEVVAMRDAAQMSGEVVVMGQMDYLVVWNHEVFRSRLDGEPLTTADFEKLAELGI